MNKLELWRSVVNSYIRQHQQDMEHDLMRLVRIPSVAKHGADGLPFGREVDNLLVAAAELFARDGFPMHISHEKGYALAVF